MRVKVGEIVRAGKLHVRGIYRAEDEVVVGHDAERARDDVGEDVEKKIKARLCNRILINAFSLSASCFSHHHALDYTTIDPHIHLRETSETSLTTARNP